MERRLGLGLDLLDRDTIGNLDQGKSVGKVHVEDTLNLTHQLVKQLLGIHSHMGESEKKN